jgi:hypothetical protein
VTTRALAALAVEAEARVKEDAAAVTEQEAQVTGLAADVRLKRDQLLDESAAAKKLLDKGGAVRGGGDTSSPLAKLPSWTAWRQACAKLEAGEQQLSATRTRLARRQVELERLHGEIERWPERAAVLARLEAAEPGLKRAAEEAQARAEHATRALEVESSLGKDASKGTPERLVLTTPGPASGAPAGPDRQLRLLLGLVLAIPLAILAALARDRQDRSLYEPETWRDALGVPVLGRVPDLSEPGPGVSVR